MLVARERVLEELLAACAAAGQGRGSVVVVTGEPGIGKTALLDAVAERRPGRLLRATAVEAEQSIAFATLQALLWPLRDHLGELDHRQAAFLRPVLELGAPQPGSSFAVAAAALALLSESARTEPLTLIVDDVHNADGASEEALCFVGRRLESEPIALLMAVRSGEQSVVAEERSFTQVAVDALEPEAARILLHAVDATLAPDVVNRLIDACAGNPLGLVELPAFLSPAQRAGDEPLPPALDAGPLLQRAFADRVGGLEPEVRHALLVLATAGDPQSALAVLGEDAALLDDADAFRLVSLRSGLDFRHPLMRSAVYGSASPEERRSTHLALAEVTSGPRRTWHLASAADGPDEEVARELDHVAREARAVGGMAAEAQALESAAALSPSPDGRASRLLGAARAWRHAGRVAHARDLLEQALPLAGTETIRIEIRLEQGKSLLREREVRKAFDLLHAEATHATESGLAARLYSAAALAANVYEGGPSPLGFAERALDLARGRGDDVELEALFAAVTARMARPVPPDDADVALVERASELLARPELRGGEEPHWIAYALAELERSDESRRLSDLAVAEARRAGDVWSLCYGLYARAASELAAGRVDAARSWVAEAVPLAEQIGEPWRVVEATIVSNQVEAARGNVDALVIEAGGTPLPPADLSVTRGRSLLARGRFEEAMEPLEQAHVALSGEGPRAWFRLLPLDLTEVYAISGHAAKAEALARRSHRRSSRATWSGRAPSCNACAACSSPRGGSTPCSATPCNCSTRLRITSSAPASS